MQHMHHFIPTYAAGTIGISVVACLFLNMIPLAGSAQERPVLPGNSGAAYYFWYSGFDARSTALADATVADPLTISGIYSNPASIIFNSRHPRLAVHSLYNSSRNIFVENITSSVSLARDKKIALGVTIHHRGFMKSYFMPDNQLTFAQYDFNLAYAQALTPTLSMGINIKSMYGEAETNSAWTNNASLGLFYAPSASVSYGVVYRGTGYQNKELGSGMYFHQAGADGNTTVFLTELPHRLEVGTTLRFPYLDTYPDFVLSFSSEKLFEESGFIYRGGIEIYILKTIILRGGYFHSSPVEGMRFGGGLLFNSVTLNYSYAVNNLDQSGESHQLTISMRF